MRYSFFYFPYEYREKQKEAIKFIQENIGKNICIDAPTGYGKTLVILSALLPFDVPIIWAVRTGNETDRPIEELKIINERKKIDIFGISFRGKRDMCFLARERRIRDYNDVSYLCKMEKENCKYYEKMDEIDLFEFIKKPLLYSEILKFCKKYGVCPYYIQLSLLPFARVVSLSYNYIINEKMSWLIKRRIPFSYSFLVVDEAHNLRKAGELFSDKITLNTLKNSIKEMQEFNNEEAMNFLKDTKKRMESMFSYMKKRELEEMRINIQQFLDFDFSLLKKYGTIIRRRRMAEGKAPRSSLHRLATFFMDSMEFLDKRGVEFIANLENKAMERWDMRSAEILRERWKEFYCCIFCSGTLSPMNAFAETIGLENWTGKKIDIQIGRCKSFILKGVSTKGEELKKEEIEKYMEAIEKFLKIDTNLAIFSASYRIQNDLLENGLNDLLDEMGKSYFIEKEGMGGEEGRKILDEFKRSKNALLIATMTGRFAEGADFPGRTLEGIFLVGIPFDKINLRTKLYLKYYKEIYGKEKGRYYAYVIPALIRASQSLGRALRSKEDKALFILGDERYKRKSYFELLPEYVKNGIEIINYDEENKIIEAWKELNEY